MEFTTEHNGRGAVRFEVRDPPPVGSVLVLRNGTTVTYRGPGPAGMLTCADKTGFEHLLFPSQIDRVDEVAAGPGRVDG
jgi:hypothetical protein